MIKIGVGPLQLEKHTPPKWVYQKYGTTKAQLPKKVNGAQSSIEKSLFH
jgi:hypothetical protein